jgi:hypothetical protein
MIRQFLEDMEWGGLDSPPEGDLRLIEAQR